MASIKKTPSGASQLRVKNKLLPKTLWATFDTRDAAEQYGAQLERLLSQGIVPSALLEQSPPKPQAWTINRWPGASSRLLSSAALHNREESANFGCFA